MLSIKLFASDLFFSEANAKGVPMAQMMFNIKLFTTNPNEGRQLIDTIAYNVSIVKEKGRPEYVYDVPLKVEKGNEYTAESGSSTGCGFS